MLRTSTEKGVWGVLHDSHEIVSEQMKILERKTQNRKQGQQNKQRKSAISE